MSWTSAFHQNKSGDNNTSIRAGSESRPRRAEYNVLRKKRGRRPKDSHRPSSDALVTHDDGDEESLRAWKEKGQKQKVSRWRRMFRRRRGS
ncbi:uncharacterized protein Z519_01106 [Cladophialophora bantiana CBS 173.52]|uniref:Uncharacterized protein n=1 Tax=Cladophialophora bantiana (strain ATCC 10958 / CBS 173.52 / CDC B-1940 / NIH 8579) TaxID=1442370 RepID=A0A0D2GGT0_CLAB1|nr:uncharacterized protein Z519_01106 [Cladophialophora bantiana CBS 173.52]KIW97522.1 hypothetical protein Z519_01106 [Cladophialophora bantiana CBS 173.52]